MVQLDKYSAYFHLNCIFFQNQKYFDGIVNTYIDGLYSTLHYSGQILNKINNIFTEN